MPEEQKPEQGKKEASSQKQSDDRKGEGKGARAISAAQQGPDEKKFEGYLTEIVEVSVGRTGIYGEIKQAMCRILEGKDKGRVIRRNVAGRIRVGDMMRLPDTSREDKPIRAR